MALLRSLLFVPANRERMLERARTSGADALVLDLEDAVPAAEKAAARTLARRAIAALAADDGDAPAPRVFVRVNGLRSGRTRADLMGVVAPGLAGVVLPKAESPQDLRDLDVLLREAEVRRGVRPGDVAVIPLIESPRGLLRCEDIVRATDRIAALSLGGEDLSRALGVEPSPDALAHARAVIVTVAAAYGVAAIDTPYTDVRDEPGLLAETKLARAMGMSGKYVIHPGRVAAVNDAFAPTKDEIARARRIVAAYDQAVKRGRGSVSVDGAMVDAPVAARARALIVQANAKR